MKKRCPLFDICPLRTFYEMSGRKADILKNHCEGRFRDCARYKLESVMGSVPGKMPVLKKRKVKK